MAGRWESGRLEVPGGPARLVSRRGAPGSGAITSAPLRILKSEGPDEYPLIASVLLENKEAAPAVCF